MKSHPTEIRNSVVARVVRGESQRTIAAALGISVGSVGSITRQFNFVSSAKNGRPQKIWTTLGRLILRRFGTGEYTTAMDAAKKLVAEGTLVHAQTIRNLLKDNNFDSRIKRPALPLTPARKKARLAFANKYKHWTKEDWKRVIFSDETKIYRLGSDGKQWTWVQRGQALRDHNANHTYKHGGGSLFLWSCITAEGPATLSRSKVDWILSFIARSWRVIWLPRCRITT